MPLIHFRTALTHRLRYLAHWRCAEPVVVFESDDWGLERRGCSDFLQKFGEPSKWADENIETVEDLEALYRTLERHCDSQGRPACFTANFIVSNPDFEAIASDCFETYHEVPILELNDSLRGKWLEGVERRVFLPQYHGRSHFWVESWLHDLRRGVPGARELFFHRCHGGLSLLKNQQSRYHSEYVEWSTGKEPTRLHLSHWLQGGLYIFQQVFGIFPHSTVAPHCIFTPKVCRALYTQGIKFMQGGNRMLWFSNGKRWTLRHVLGERSPEGLVFMLRNVIFEPWFDSSYCGVAAVLEQVYRCWQSHIPAIIQTHRIHYTAPWRHKALIELDTFLSALKTHRVLFLTTVELGEAIINNGVFHDIWTGETRYLTPVNSALGYSLRKFFEKRSAYLTRRELSDG